MSTTARLLNVRPLPRWPWTARFAEVADRLVAAHGVPRLGNFRDPIKEIFYILLSAKTTDAQYRKTHRRLWTRFPGLAALASARIRDIRRCIESGGLAAKRAVHVRQTARILLEKGGPNPAKYLKSLDETEAFALLSELPGLGPKSALCVMMYSLGFDAFAVDVNVQRIAERMGAIPPGLSHSQAQRRLARALPLGRSRDLHVGMVVHGRKICLPRTPQCGSCPLADACRTGRRERDRNGE